MGAEIAEPPDGFKVGDILILFRTGPGDDGDYASPATTRHAIMAALSKAGLRPSEGSLRDHEDIMAFRERGTLLEPMILTLGRSGWNPPGR